MGYFFSFIEGHHLNRHVIHRVFSIGYGIVEITNGKIGIVSGHVIGLLAIEASDALISFVVKLQIIPS